MRARPALNIRVEERIELLAEPKRRSTGVSIAIGASLVLHVLFVTWAVRNYHPVQVSDTPQPVMRYVELLKNNPEFTEAPGKKAQQAPLKGLFSDENRKAATPNPTGDQPTQRPGNGGPVYTPPASPGGQTAQQRAAQRPMQASDGAQQQQQASAATPQQSEASAAMSDLVYHPPSTKASAAVDWRSAIKEVGKVASLGGSQQNLDLGNQGGEKGFAENGPLSFETQWYDWGAYAQSMVSRIRVNWYANMPDLIRAGMKGVVTIRFTIQRSGAITDIQILNGSGIPPYDFAAKKAIELSSPLNPLPEDFPKNSERVTCMFYYNLEPPSR